MLVEIVKVHTDPKTLFALFKVFIAYTDKAPEDLQDCTDMIMSTLSALVDTRSVHIQREVQLRNSGQSGTSTSESSRNRQ